MLVKQKQTSKLDMPFNPKPCKVKVIEQTMVTATRKDKDITQNLEHFTKIKADASKET